MNSDRVIMSAVEDAVTLQNLGIVTQSLFLECADCNGRMLLLQSLKSFAGSSNDLTEGGWSRIVP